MLCVPFCNGTSEKASVGALAFLLPKLCDHCSRVISIDSSPVLIIDLDMNHGATRHFGVVPEAFMGSYEMLVGDEQAAHLVLTDQDEDVLLPQNLHLIPAARKLEGIDQALAQKSKFITPREVLIRPLESLRGQYNYIFLDTAPNATTPTIASYLAADYFILSAMPDPFAIAGLNDALTDIGDAQKRGNPKLSLLGVVLSGVDKRTTLANSLSEFVERSFRVGEAAESIKFRASIARSTVIPQTQKAGKTLFETHPTHKVTQEYRALAEEIETRVARLEAGPAVRNAANG
ncbi:MAG: ParA family protein [Verrucomicrobiales bacterium]|nr:ParA family protein [Verrucomicrobiales bacterium]